LRVPVDTAFPLDRFADAYARLAGPGKFGKVVVVPSALRGSTNVLR
jgi:hypothetical protein